METPRKKIVIVDDDRTNLTVARNALIDSYDPFTVSSASKLYEVLEKVTPDLILLDVEMPELDGFSVMKVLKSSAKTAHIPVIFLTALNDPENEIRGLDLGAADYIFKPFSRALLLKRIELHLLVEAQRQELAEYSSNLESIVIEKTQEVFELQNAILGAISELVECRDNLTGGHIDRTQSYLRLLVDIMLRNGVYTRELSTWDIDLFIMSSQLHDVGKISIRDDVLLKPGKLTNEEFDEMKRHTSFGREIIERIERNTKETAFLDHAKIMAASHHEKWDGSGYPLGLEGEDIPLQGRLMAIIDVYDALTNDRSYKKAFSHEESLEIIKSGIGKHFDPLLGELFIRYESAFAGSDAKSGTHRFKLKPSAQLNAILKTLSSISGLRGGTMEERAERIKRYLNVFIGALLQHNVYKDELSKWDLEIFLVTAQLHDVGDIVVSDSILKKTGKLTSMDYSNNLEYHTEFGVKVIQTIRESVEDEGLLHHAEILAASHHEKWDGSGYPKGLKGEEIPLQGRIMALIDLFDALTNDRPYRDMIDHAEVVDIIKNLSGTQFDPGLVEVFLENEKSFEGGETE